MATKKLIEVALPLDKINAASAREKSIRHGHPSTLHLWWARRPLAAARAVIWSSLVDDPSSHPELFPTEEDQNRERQRLFKILEDLVVWENSNNQDVLNAAKAEIMKSTNGNPPALFYMCRRAKAGITTKKPFQGIIVNSSNQPDISTAAKNSFSKHISGASRRINIKKKLPAPENKTVFRGRQSPESLKQASLDLIS